MNYMQYLRIIWARRGVALLTAILVAAAGIGASITLIKSKYTSEVSLVFDAKPDPTAGSSNWQPGPDVGTQLEILRSDRVAQRAVELLELEQDPKSIEAWKGAVPDGSIPLKVFLARSLQRSLTVEPARASNLITLSVSADNARFAAEAANAIAQAYLDVSVDLRVAPAKQYAVWFEQQSSVLRADLERAQARLSKFQQERKIVGQDDRVDEEIAKLNVLTSQLAAAQAQSAEAFGRAAFGGESSLDVQQSAVVAGLKSELARAEARLQEISSIVGSNHPQRLGLEAQIGELRRQIAAEMSRVSGGTAAASRAQARKVAELQSLVDQQRSRVLSMRGSRDEIAVLIKDVESAQRAYENARTRMSELSLQSANMQANVRILSPAVEALAPKSKVPVAVLASIIGALIAGIAMAVFLETLDPRVRGLDDLDGVDGVPVIGVLETPNARRPAYRRFALGMGGERKLLPMSSPTAEGNP